MFGKMWWPIMCWWYHI